MQTARLCKNIKTGSQGCVPSSRNRNRYLECASYNFVENVKSRSRYHWLPHKCVSVDSTLSSRCFIIVVYHRSLVQNWFLHFYSFLKYKLEVYVNGDLNYDGVRWGQVRGEIFHFITDFHETKLLRTTLWLNNTIILRKVEIGNYINQIEFWFPNLNPKVQNIPRRYHCGG